MLYDGYWGVLIHPLRVYIATGADASTSLAEQVKRHEKADFLIARSRQSNVTIELYFLFGEFRASTVVTTEDPSRSRDCAGLNLRRLWWRIGVVVSPRAPCV